MRTLLVLAATLATPVAAFAATRPLTKAEKKVIGKRLAKVVNYRRSLAISEGSTVFVVRRIKVPKAKLRGTSLDYEGLLIAGRQVPAGINIDERIDQVTIRPGRRNTVEITFRYAIAVAPGARSGGSLLLDLKPPKFSTVQLAYVPGPDNALEEITTLAIGSSAGSPASSSVVRERPSTAALLLRELAPPRARDPVLL